MEYFIFILCVMLGIPGSLLLLGAAFNSGDAFYFIRKAQFKRKLRQLGFTNTWDFLDTLLTTTVSDWKKEGKSMSYNPFPNTTITFEYVRSNNIDLIIREGSGQKWVLWIEFFDFNDEAYLKDACDLLTKQNANETESFQLKQIMLQLKEMYDHFAKMEQEQRAFEQKQEQARKAQKIAAHERALEQKKEQLLALLSKPFAQRERLTSEGFCVTKATKDVYQTLTISLEDTLYFQAMLMQHTGKLTMRFENEQETYGAMFASCKKEIESFAKQQLTQEELEATTCENVVVNPFASSLLTEEQQEVVEGILHLLAELNEQQEWLSTTAFHHVTETFPKDLQALMVSYAVVKEKENVQRDVSSSLDTMYHKLVAFTEEAEQNKQRNVQKTKLIIEKR